VEQQGAATAEIVRNVSETATAAHEMIERTTEVAAEAEQTGKHAAEVRQNATGLNAAVGDLRQSVIRVVRESSADVDRRHAHRYPVDLSASLVVSGRPVSSVRVTDLSEGGARVHGGPPLPEGMRGTLRFDKEDLAVPFTARAGEDHDLHLMFQPDAVTAARLAPLIKRAA
jgi:hypothetical protein